VCLVVVLIVAMSVIYMTASSWIQSYNRALVVGSSECESLSCSWVNLVNPSKEEINVLIIGYNPQDRLTDSLLFVNVEKGDTKIDVFNLPRDIYVETTMDHQESDLKIQSKINAIWKNLQNQGFSETQAADKLTQLISQEIDQTIDGWVLTNYNALSQAVEDIGNIEVNNPKRITDCEFPRGKFTKGFDQCIVLPEGKLQLDPQTVVLYARSRKSTSDFDRSHRQMLVLQAIWGNLQDTAPWKLKPKVKQMIKGQKGLTKTNLGTKTVLQIVKYSKNNQWQTHVLNSQQMILCPDRQTNKGYRLQYCDNVNFGSSQTSQSRLKLRKVLAE
jgi:LCP family protein required for cell wall assembly